MTNELETCVMCKGPKKKQELYCSTECSHNAMHAYDRLVNTGRTDEWVYPKAEAPK